MRTEYGVIAIFVLTLSGTFLFHSAIEIAILRFTPAQELANVVGVSASIEPNPYNTLATQFEQKEQEIRAREQALLAREKILPEGGTDPVARLTLFVSLIGFFLLSLILTNFYLDIRRRA